MTTLDTINSVIDSPLLDKALDFAIQHSFIRQTATVAEVRLWAKDGVKWAYDTIALFQGAPALPE